MNQITKFHLLYVSIHIFFLILVKFLKFLILFLSDLLVKLENRDDIQKTGSHACFQLVT